MEAEIDLEAIFSATHAKLAAMPAYSPDDNEWHPARRYEPVALAASIAKISDRLKAMPEISAEEQQRRDHEQQIAQRSERWQKLAAQFGPKYAGRRLTTFEIDGPYAKAKQTVVAAVRGYDDDMPARVKEGQNVVIIGPSGVGKDHLCVATFALGDDPVRPGRHLGERGGLLPRTARPDDLPRARREADFATLQPHDSLPVRSSPAFRRIDAVPGRRAVFGDRPAIPCEQTHMDNAERAGFRRGKPASWTSTGRPDERQRARPTLCVAELSKDKDMKKSKEVRDFETAARAAHARSEAWAAFWGKHGDAIRGRADRLRRCRLVGRLMGLLVSGDLDGQEPIPSGLLWGSEDPDPDDQEPSE